MVTVYPPPVYELVDNLRNFIEWELWHREKMFPTLPGLRKQKIREAEGALMALDQLESIARRELSCGLHGAHKK
jgi:hypothetical protein